MTTQELRNYIDRVLGNSIRCLLPSYWWKRLFNQVADRIEEVEQSTSELIEASKMPIVESESDLSQLDLPKGSVAAARESRRSTVKISDCYFSENPEEDWEKYTIVKHVEEKANTADKENNVVFSASKDWTKDTYVVNTSNTGIFYYLRVIDGTYSEATLSIVNEALSSGKYRAIEKLGEPDQYFTFYSEISQPSLFIKGVSWERLAKESDIQGIGGGNIQEEITALNEVVNALNEKSKVVRVYAPFGKEYSESNILLPDEYKAKNSAIYERVENGEVLFADIYGGYDYAESQYYTGTRYFNALKGTLVGNRAVFRIEDNDRNQSYVMQIEISADGSAEIYHKFMTDKAYVDNAIASAITNTLNTEV